MSYEPGDEYLSGVISHCCSSNIIEPDICANCHEHCSPADEEPDPQPEGDFSGASEDPTWGGR